MPYTLKEIQDAFEKFDTNPKDGKLSKKELIAILTRPGGGHSFTERWAEEFIERCDFDGDGKLSIDELARAMEETSSMGRDGSTAAMVFMEGMKFQAGDAVPAGTKYIGGFYIKEDQSTVIVKDEFTDMTKADAMAKLTGWVKDNPETHIGEMTYYFMAGWSGTLYEATGVSSTGDPKSPFKWPPGTVLTGYRALGYRAVAVDKDRFKFGEDLWHRYLVLGGDEFFGRS